MPDTTLVCTTYSCNEEPRLDPENYLYHYTDAQGLQGILESGKLRATLYTMLNDPEEMVRGWSIVASELPKDEDSYSWFGKEWSDRSRDHYFISSLTEHADDIDMWRGYGGGGFNIIFDRGSLAQSAREGSLLKVVYTEEELRQRARRYINLVVSTKGAEIITSPNDDLASSGDGLVNLGAAYKDAAWSHETEWRLVTKRHILCGADDEDRYCMKFAPSHYGPRPYVEQKIADLSCIMGVTVGPGPYMEERATAAAWLMDQNGMPNHPAYCSKIHYRA